MMERIVIPRSELRGMYFFASVLLVLFLVLGSITPVSAHTTINVDHITIEVGWGLEPPVVGIRNDFVFKITQPGETEGTYRGVASAFKNLEATAMYGGVTKKIDINSDPRRGYYFSPVIPTKTGTIVIELDGEIDGVKIDKQIPIEGVESTAILDFPPTSSQSSNSDIIALKNGLKSLQQDVYSIKSGQGVEIMDGGASYDIAVFGLSLGAAGVIMGIVSMTRKKVLG